MPKAFLALADVGVGFLVAVFLLAVVWPVKPWLVAAFLLPPTIIAPVVAAVHDVHGATRPRKAERQQEQPLPHHG